VNLGGATAADVHALLDVIRARVPVPMELEYELWPEQLPEPDRTAAPQDGPAL